ncbi:MAG: FAD-dependent thymidylate synthase [Desulfomonilaceae bacterium]|jgi:thymidylate synthase (FAD)|nr:FAD-dependent thymidylate synthase [Syntrophaceae bacterium]
MIIIDDPWKELRSSCFGNVEPEIILEAVTVPLENLGTRMEKRDLWETIETLPAWSAAISYGSREKMADDMERKRSLNRKLIGLGHMTPIESLQFNFRVSGISKACGAQMSRHRIGQGHVSSSRRFQAQGAAFVYPLLSYITNETDARDALMKLSDVNRKAYEIYEDLRNSNKLHKEDARRAIPVASSQERVWWINARALRDFLRLRLPKDAEWEIRRIAVMLYNLVSEATPSLFDDIVIK